VSPLRLTIFHTNDMHGNVEILPPLSSLRRRLRGEALAEGRQTFFWDAGDAADRRLEICRATKGAAFYPILNAMGYDLQTMGNAISLPYGPQAMVKVAARAEFPILAANFRDDMGPQPEGLKEAALLDLKDGVRMGVIGLTSEWGGMYEVFGLHFPDAHRLAEELMHQLVRQGAALIVVLSHLGLEADRRLAEAVPGIDLIIGAHSHDLLERGVQVGETLIAQAGEYGLHLGRVDLALDPRSGRILERQARVIEVPADEADDPGVVSAIEAARQEVTTLLREEIGTLSVPLGVAHFEECDMGNMAADALRAHMAAQIAVVASGHFHQGLPVGRVTQGDLNQACFSTANPGVSLVSGRQIIAAMEKGLDRFHSRQEPGGFRGTPVGMPQISGLRIEYGPDRRPGERIRSISIDDRRLDPAGEYSLAHTDAEIHDEIGYLALGAGQQPRMDVPTILPEVIREYIRAHSPLDKPAGPRWLPV
jgi:5'-nucleotidase